MEDRPGARQRAYLEECLPFDPATSPAYPKWSILRDYLASGKRRSGRVGGARWHLFDAADLVQFAIG